MSNTVYIISWFASHLCWTIVYNNHQDWLFFLSRVERPPPPICQICYLNNLNYQLLSQFLDCCLRGLEALLSFTRVANGKGTIAAQLQKSMNWVWLTESQLLCGKSIMLIFSTYTNQVRQKPAATSPF